MRPIYKVIDNLFLAETKKYPTKLLDQCKNNPNKPQNLPSEVKVALKTIAMEQWLFVQVVMIRQNEAENQKK